MAALGRAQREAQRSLTIAAAGRPPPRPAVHPRRSHSAVRARSARLRSWIRAPWSWVSTSARAGRAWPSRYVAVARSRSSRGPKRTSTSPATADASSPGSTISTRSPSASTPRSGRVAQGARPPRGRAPVTPRSRTAASPSIRCRRGRWRRRPAASTPGWRPAGSTSASWAGAASSRRRTARWRGRSVRRRRRSRSTRTARSRPCSAARRRPRAPAPGCACASRRCAPPGWSGTSTSTTTRWTRSPRRSRRGASCRAAPRRSATSVTASSGCR